MKLERLVGILMILLHERSITAKLLAHRFGVSIRTIQRDIDILSVAGIPITSQIGPKGGYSLMDNYTLDKTFLRKDEMKLLTDLLGGLEKLLSQVGFDEMKERMHILQEKEVSSSIESIRFDFMPWLPQHVNKENLALILESITNHQQIEIVYRDQKGNCTCRRIEPYQLVMKDYAWYVYGYCMERNGFRYFKIMRIQQLKILEEKFITRDFVVEEPFADLKLIEIKLKFSLNAVGRVEDYFCDSDNIYANDHILVHTQYPDDPWLYQLLLSFGKEVQVLEPEHIRKKVREEALEMINTYTHNINESS